MVVYLVTSEYGDTLMCLFIFPIIIGQTHSEETKLCTALPHNKDRGEYGLRIRIRVELGLDLGYPFCALGSTVAIVLMHLEKRFWCGTQ